jgi:cell division protease FtsH
MTGRLLVSERCDDDWRSMNETLRNIALWVIIVLLALALFTLFQNPGYRTSDQEISFSQLLNEVDQGRVRDVLIQGPEIRGTFANGRSFQTYAPAQSDPSLIQRLYSKGVSITFRPQQNDVPWFVSLLVSWLPFIALIGVWIFLSRQMQGARTKRDEVDALKRQIDELQKRLDELRDKDKP